VFEDKELADQAVIAVEKRIHFEDMDPVAPVESTKQPAPIHTETATPAEVAEKKV
jgi:hypothetical protein